MATSTTGMRTACPPPRQQQLHLHPPCLTFWPGLRGPYRRASYFTYTGVMPRSRSSSSSRLQAGRRRGGPGWRMQDVEARFAALQPRGCPPVGPASRDGAIAAGWVLQGASHTRRQGSTQQPTLSMLTSRCSDRRRRSCRRRRARGTGAGPAHAPQSVQGQGVCARHGRHEPWFAKLAHPGHCQARQRLPCPQAPCLTGLACPLGGWLRPLTSRSRAASLLSSTTKSRSKRDSSESGRPMLRVMEMVRS